MLGQPTLRHRLRQGAFAALDQRVAVRYAIGGLTAAETTSYVAFGAAVGLGAVKVGVGPRRGVGFSAGPFPRTTDSWHECETSG
jgi:hypothetical protein